MSQSLHATELIEVIPGRMLSDELLKTWSDIQISTQLLESPFFRPEYTQAVAAIRDNVQVAVVYRDGRPEAFFPFQRRMRVRSRPVGCRLADYQGLIARPTFEIDPKQLLRACGLLSWRFYSVPVSQQSFAPFQLLAGRSPFVDATRLATAEANSRSGSHRNGRSSTRRKVRKLEREVGPLRLDFANRDPQLLGQLVQWKSAACKASHSYNALAQPWVQEVVREALNFSDADFSGSFATLHAGDRLLAIVLGLRSGDVYHTWMTSYDAEYASYSPGRILFSRLVQALPQLGIRRLDFGGGNEAFKWHFSNGYTPLWEGAVDLRPLVPTARLAWLKARDQVNNSLFRKLVHVPWSVIRPLRDWTTY